MKFCVFRFWTNILFTAVTSSSHEYLPPLPVTKPPSPLDVLQLPPPPPIHTLYSTSQTDGPSSISQTPTELLERSVANLKLKKNENFQKEAGKVLSSMLHSRMNPDRTTTTTNNSNQHPMKTVINLCDNKPPALPVTPPPPAHNHKHKYHQEIYLTPRSPGPLSPRTPPPSFIASIFPEEYIPEQQQQPQSTCNYVSTLVLPTEPIITPILNGKPPISPPPAPQSSFGNEQPILRRTGKCANNNNRDQRSIIRKSLILDHQSQRAATDVNSNQIIIPINNKKIDTSSDIENEIMTKRIAEELDEGKEPICWKCNRKVPR